VEAAALAAVEVFRAGAVVASAVEVQVDVGKLNRSRIEKEVAQIESKTMGEIVPVIVGRSDPYPAVTGLAALFGVLIGALAVTLFDPGIEAEMLAVFLPVFAVLGWFFSRWSFVARFLAGEKAIEREVHERAVRAFFELDMASTTARTGVVILFSIFERRIEVIADRGIHEKVRPEFWAGIVSQSAEVIRRQGLEAGVLHALNAVGEVLIREFPRAAGTPGNEIPNRVIVEP
jgi:putative membrane protein